MRIDNMGFVGIGTTTPGQRLTVEGVIHSRTGGFMFPDGTTQITAGGAGGGGTLPAGTLTGQTLRWTSTPNSWLANSNLFNDGTNVGIGTTSPGHRLDIHTGAARVTTYDFGLEITANTTGGWARSMRIRNEHNNATAAFGALHGEAYIATGFNPVTDPTGHQSPRLLVTSTGNVGIGMTAPLSRVQIQGHGTTTAGTLNVTASDGASRFFVRDDGNVGIGTTTPTTRLDIEGQIRIRGGTPAAGRVLTADATGLATWATPAGGLPTGTASQTLRHDGTNWVANSNIFNTGTNIGIGTTTPGARLEVAGNIIADPPIAQKHVATRGWVEAAASGGARGWDVCQTASSFTGYLGGYSGANALCAAACGVGFVMLNTNHLIAAAQGSTILIPIHPEPLRTRGLAAHFFASITTQAPQAWFSAST